MLDVFKLAQAVNEGAVYGSVSTGDYEPVSLAGMSLDEACGEVNYIIACESADITEFYANSTNILIEAAMTGDQERVQYINEASAKEVKNKIIEFFKKIIGAVKAFFQKIGTAIKNFFAKIKAWFKSKKKNKAGKEDTIENHIKNMKEDIPADTASAAPNLSPWNDSLMDKTLDEYDSADVMEGLDSEVKAELIKTVERIKQYRTDKYKSGDTDEGVAKLAEIAEVCRTAGDEGVKMIDTDFKSGTAKNPHKRSDINAMYDVLANEPTKKMDRIQTIVLKGLSEMEKAGLDIANSTDDGNNAYIQKVVNAYQSAVSALTTATNKIVNRMVNLVRERSSEYQRACDWAVANNGKYGGVSATSGTYAE